MSVESLIPASFPNDGPAWRAARAAGFDMDLLEESLALSPEERLRLHNIALRRVELLEAAMKEARDGARPPAVNVGMSRDMSTPNKP